MPYTPEFQKFLNRIKRLAQKNTSIETVQEEFAKGLIELGPYERLNNLYRIRPKRAVPGERERRLFFRMNKMQEDFWRTKTNRDLVLKMRQGGVTTFSCLIALDKALFEEGVHTAIMAHVKDSVKKFFRIIKNAFLDFERDWGAYYPVTATTDNVNELGIKQTGSFLSVITEGKGLTLDFLHISEAAYVEDERISESLESVPASGWAILESTADRASGMYYDLWNQATREEFSSFKAHFFPWWFQYPEEEDIPNLKASPEFQYTEEEEALTKQHDLQKEHMLWRRLKISECGGDKGEFLRKYPEDDSSCFLSGAKSFFPGNILQTLWRNSTSPAFTGDLVLG